MPVLNTPRAGKNRPDYMESLITNMYMDQNVFFKQRYGTFDINPEMIINSFYSTRNLYRKMNTVKVHYIEIWLEHEYGRQEAVAVADLMGRYILNQGFQSFVSIVEVGNTYLIAIAINSTSYKDGRTFQDNNMQYVHLYNMLRKRLPFQWSLSVSESTFFDPEDGTGNYIHGYFA